MMKETVLLDKVYKPDEVEDRLYLSWMSSGYFHGDENSDKEPYTIVEWKERKRFGFRELTTLQLLLKLKL